MQRQKIGVAAHQNVSAPVDYDVEEPVVAAVSACLKHLDYLTVLMIGASAAAGSRHPRTYATCSPLPGLFVVIDSKLEPMTELEPETC